MTVEFKHTGAAHLEEEVMVFRYVGSGRIEKSVNRVLCRNPKIAFRFLLSQSLKTRLWEQDEEGSL